MANVSAALRTRSIRWIGALYALGLLVEWSLSIALMVLAYDATDSAVVAAAMLLCAQVFPNAALALTTSVLDRLAIKPLYLAATIGQAAGILAIAFSSYGPAFFALAALVGSARRSLARRCVVVLDALLAAMRRRSELETRCSVCCEARRV